MSMRVFYAYLFRENATFNDIQEASAYINELRTKFIKWVPSDMVKMPKLPEVVEFSHFEQMKMLEDDTKGSSNHGAWDYQLQCTMFAREIDGVNYIAFQFFPSRRVVKFLEENVKLREFWYENQTDEGFDLPDWEFRSKFWNTVYSSYLTPAQAGFACDIYDGTQFAITNSIIRELDVLIENKKEQKE